MKPDFVVKVIHIEIEANIFICVSHSWYDMYIGNMFSYDIEFDFYIRSYVIVHIIDVVMHMYMVLHYES